MKIRSHRYLGTFVNNDEGLSSYKLMVKHIRQVVRGGRFIKMFRGNSRLFHTWNGVDGKPYKSWSGCSRKEGATHFDVYLMGRGNNIPTFYQWKLV